MMLRWLQTTCLPIASASTPARPRGPALSRLTTSEPSLPKPGVAGSNPAGAHHLFVRGTSPARVVSLQIMVGYCQVSHGVSPPMCGDIPRTIEPLQGVASIQANRSVACTRLISDMAEVIFSSARTACRKSLSALRLYPTPYFFLSSSKS